MFWSFCLPTIYRIAAKNEPNFYGARLWVFVRDAANNHPSTQLGPPKKSSRFLNFIKQIFEVFKNLSRWVVGMSGSLKAT
jgi:hypothetical protein